MKSRIAAALGAVSGKSLQRLPNSPPEIKNRCSDRAKTRAIPASIRKSGPEIKNRCTKDGINRQNLASIRKSGPEIRNRCTKEGVNGEKLASIRKSGPEIKNRCSNDRNRRNHSSLRQRRIESDADHVGRQGLAPLRSFTIYSVNYFYFCSSDYICSMERNGMVWFWIYI